jgi:hypothetical protein
MIHLFGQTHQGFLDCRGKREFEFRKIYIAANKSVNRTVELLVSEYNTILSFLFADLLLRLLVFTRPKCVTSRDLRSHFRGLQ